MTKLIDLLKELLKVKQWWKFYGILGFLGFLAYLFFGNGIQHAGMVKDAIFDEPVKVETANETD